MFFAVSFLEVGTCAVDFWDVLFPPKFAFNDVYVPFNSGVSRLASLINVNGSFEFIYSNKDPFCDLWKLTRIGRLFYLNLFGIPS